MITNEDLKPGMYVKLKNGVEGVLLPWKGQLTVVGFDSERSRGAALATARIYDNKYKSSTMQNYSIVSVWLDNFENNATNGCFTSCGRTKLWEYEEPVKEMTVGEIEDELGYRIKIVEG
jgi:hypothetical protein